MTELANDAVDWLNSLSSQKDPSLTPRMHVRSMDEKHIALWLVISVMNLIDNRQLPVNVRGLMQRLRCYSRGCQTILAGRRQGSWPPSRLQLFCSC